MGAFARWQTAFVGHAGLNSVERSIDPYSDHSTEASTLVTRVRIDSDSLIIRDGRVGRKKIWCPRRIMLFIVE